MIDVKRPRLLNSSLQETATLKPLGLQLTLQSPGVSTAVLTLNPNDPEPGMHSWIELYNQNGSVGFYRVTSPTTDYAQQASVTLRHGIDCMADSVLAAQEDFEGTPTELLTRIIAAQTTRINNTAPWALGTVAATSTIKMSLNYNRLSDLLTALEEELEGYYFEYDQSAFPWVLSVKAAPTTADCELRMNRNVMTINRTLTDNDLCTQLILSINSKVTSDDVTTTNTYIKTYDNTTAQAIYGIVQKTADIDTADDLTVTTSQPVPSTPEADAWAARFLSDHAAPTVQIQIAAKELKRITGDTWDEAKLSHMCRVALPEYNQTFTERVVTVSYPDALGQPDVVNVSLANQLPKFSSSIAKLREETARLARASRGAGRSAASAEELEVWSKHVNYYGEALDGTGVLTLYESGIDMSGTGGVTIYSLQEGLQSLYSGITVNANKISLVVTSSGGQDVINTAAIVLGINSQDKTSSSYVDISANYINLTGYVTATTLDARLVNADALFSQTGYIGTIRASAVSASGNITASGAVIGTGVYFGSAAPYTDVGNAIASFGTATSSSGTITIPTTKLNGTAGGSITFNIADTAYYQSHVGIASLVNYQNSTSGHDYDDWSGTALGTLAANTYYQFRATANNGGTANIKFKTPASSSVTLGDPSWSSPIEESGNVYSTVTVTASPGGETSSQKVYLTVGSWSNGSVTLRCRQSSSTGSTIMDRTVSLPATATWAWSYPTATTIQASCTVRGKTYVSTHSV